MSEEVDLVIVLPSLVAGGAERVMVTLSTRLARRGLKVALICLNADGPLKVQLSPDVDLVDLGTPRLRNAVPRLVAALRRIRPRAVLSTLGYVNLAVLAARRLLPRGCRLLVREANLPSQALSRARFARLMRFGMRLLYPSADLVIASSERMRTELAANFNVPASKLQVLPNPVDRQTIRSTLPALHARPQGRELHVVAAGRLTHQKGFDRLIRAVADSGRSIRLTILGEGALRDDLRAQAQEMGVSLNLPGLVVPPWPDLAAADVFVLSSRWEGQPNIVLEALVCGVPIIAMRDAGGVAELAAQAPGAITLVPDEAALPPALATAALPDAMPGPDRLPDAYGADEVGAHLAALLSQAQ